ncbi:MAG: type III secretion system export apparatus subunit SctU [Gammaproteobacteria bacterium]|nr:type III secretion system export apparatus subunit SctU [Gammaproteobacteria bacterium]
MSKQENSGDKTERATPKRLRDARKRGEIPKSKDLTNTLGLAFTLVLLWFTFSSNLDRLSQMLSDSLTMVDVPFHLALKTIGFEAIKTFLTLSAIVLLPIAAIGLLLEFLQTGPIFSLQKLTPQLQKLSPVAGMKRMFSMDNFIELLKSIGKTAILFIVAWFVIRAFIYELVLMPENETITIIAAAKTLLFQLFLWTLGVFIIIMALDTSYQHYSFAKKMRMSLRDIKQEHKETEGDPQVKSQRKSMHKEFAEEGASEAARSATVLVVNPTHVAIAINYDKEECPVPTVAAKGEEEVAQSMRDAANEAHVPVLRNELLARTLLGNVSEGDVVPKDLFDVVAEVILWAMRTQESIDRTLGTTPAYTEQSPVPTPPGEDLTTYPDGYEPVADTSVAATEAPA